MLKDPLRPTLSSSTALILSVLRIVAGFLFIAHGTQKLLSIPTAFPGGPVEVTSLVGIAGLLELVGGGLLLIGLLTRPVALILSGEMAAAYFMMHAPKGFWPIMNGGELAVIYCFLFLFFVSAGPGPISLDAWLRRQPYVQPQVQKRRAA